MGNGEWGIGNWELGIFSVSHSPTLPLSHSSSLPHFVTLPLPPNDI
ncbi:MAG: hypothetical protein U7126_30130 [Microcoleus sp.]